MPYKDPERKRQWEREHREQRNAKRTKQHVAAQMKPCLPNPVPDPSSDQPTKSAWKIIAVCALAVGSGLLTGWGRLPSADAVLSGRERQ